MTPSADNRAGPAFVARRLFLARLALVWEDLVIRSWRAAFLVILFLGLVLLGVVSSLPGILHIALLVFFAIATPLALWRDFRDSPGLRKCMCDAVSKSGAVCRTGH